MLRKFLFAVAIILIEVLNAHATDAPITVGSVTFQVKVTVLPTCRTSTATTATAGGTSDIDFGSQDSDGVNLSQSGGSGTAGISVTCSNTTPYVVKLTPSNSNTAGAGLLTGGVASPQQTIAYQLKNNTAAWGNTGSVTSGVASVGNSVTGTGSGSAQGYQVKATIAGIGGVAPGVYQDTVTVVVTY